MIREFLRARNPLVLPATSLPGPLLLMARLVILVLMIRGYAIAYMPGRGVPFVAALEAVGSDASWRRGLTALFLAGATLVFFNLRPRLGCFMVGASLVIGTLIDSAGYANSRLFPGCLLVLTGLQDGTMLARFALRAQIFLLYLGAFLSKLFEPDWWSGQYFEFWLREKLGIVWYARAADAFPPMSLSAFMGVSTIVMEFVIFGCMLRRSWRPLGFAAALLFHVGAFLVCGLDFGVFLYVSIVSFLVFAPDDFHERLASLPIGPIGRALLHPAAWIALFVALPLSSRVGLSGQKIAMSAITITVLWIALTYLRAERPRKPEPTPAR